MQFNRFLSLYLLIAACCGILYNYDLFTTRSFLEILYGFFLYSSLFISIFMAFTLSKKTGSIGIILFHMAGFGLCYFHYVYNRPLTYDILAAILESNRFEIFSFLTPVLVATFLAAIIVSGVTLYLFRKITIGKRQVFCCFLVFMSLFLLLKEGGKLYIDKVNPDSSFRYYLGTRNITPISLCALFKTYWSEESKAQRLASLPSTADFPSTCSDDKPIVVLVLGESARGDHFSLNGYSRKTNPNLEKEPNLINMGIARSFDVQTRKSLIGMLTNATEKNRIPTLGSFISLYNKHGFRTCFYSRQNRLGRSGHLTDTLIGTAQDIKYLSTASDQAMLNETEPLFREYDQGLLLLLHTTGSHFDYRHNYTDEFRVFVPDEYTPETLNDHRQNVINAYDNTIVKTDDFLFRLYNQLRDRNAVVVYVSDHGQLLGEHGRFLHAIGGTDTVYPEQKNIPFLIWYSPLYGERHPDIVRALKDTAASGKTVTHDSLFHTIIPLGGIRSAIVSSDLDMTGQGSLKNR